MATETELTQLTMNVVESQEVFDKMVQSGQVRDEEFYYVLGSISLTPEERQAIVNDVLTALPKWNWGAY